MTISTSRIRIITFVALSALAGAYLVISRPAYLTNVQYLGAILFLEVIAAVVWNYRQRFFPFLLIIFMLAGTRLPLSDAANIARWLVLGVGAICGAAIFAKDHLKPFHALHVVAFCCVASAATSAAVCSYPKQALLKALSLLLLFVYGACGARLAILRREQESVSGFLAGCELLIYFSAIQYFVFHSEFFGNPNSLGMVMGVVGVPLMFWGVLTSPNVRLRRRRTFALLLAIALLLSSYARAGMIAAAISCILLCVLLGRYRLLVKGATVSFLMAMLVAALVPLRNAAEQPASLKSRFLFKGKQQAGVLGSRTSVWDSTISSIEQHPWFGSGFGTVNTKYDSNPNRVGNFSSNTLTTREHGNSYLAIAEGVGLLGVLPFFFMIALVVVNSGRVLKRLRQTRDPSPLAVALAIILVGGLVHAFFEDWLFAVGNYICVFFWSLAFVLPDLLPAAARDMPHSESYEAHEAWARVAALSSGF